MTTQDIEFGLDSFVPNGEASGAWAPDHAHDRGLRLVKPGNRLLGIRGVADRPDAGRSRQRMKESFIR